MKSTTVAMVTMATLVGVSPLSKNLISLGATLLISTLLSTVIISQLFNSWFAFILFLVFITGLLVLFSYMVAMSPNSSFTQSKLSTKTLLTLTLMYSMMNNKLNSPTKSEKSFETDLQQLFNLKNTPIYWMMGIILLMALLMAVMISYKSAKPLRSYL